MRSNTLCTSATVHKRPTENWLHSRISFALLSPPRAPDKFYTALHYNSWQPAETQPLTHYFCWCITLLMITLYFKCLFWYNEGTCSVLLKIYYIIIVLRRPASLASSDATIERNSWLFIITNKEKVNSAHVVNNMIVDHIHVVTAIVNWISIIKNMFP